MKRRTWAELYERWYIAGLWDETDLLRARKRHPRRIRAQQIAQIRQKRRADKRRLKDADDDTT
jgi:hypothetical protein